jgi:hypothetical protein
MCKFSNSLTWSSSCGSCCALTGRLLGSFSAGAGAGAGACLGGCAGAGACLGGCAGSVVSKNETGFFVMVACGAFTTDMSYETLGAIIYSMCREKEKLENLRDIQETPTQDLSLTL